MNYVRQALAALASAGLITACGGGGADPLPDVQVEGCVLNDAAPAAGVSVHARSEDGRLLASTTSNQQGIYTLRVPAQHSVALSTGLVSDAELVVLTGRSDFSIGGCLRRVA